MYHSRLVAVVGFTFYCHCSYVVIHRNVWSTLTLIQLSPFRGLVRQVQISISQRLFISKLLLEVRNDKDINLSSLRKEADVEVSKGEPKEIKFLL